MFKSNTESYSESWKGIADSTITELDNLQTLFYGGLLQVPLGCSIPLLYWECGGLLMCNRMLKSKMLFLHHLATVSPDCSLSGLPNTEKVGTTWITNGMSGTIGNISKSWNNQLFQSRVEKISCPKIDLKNQDDLLEQIKSPYKRISYNELIAEKCELKPCMKNLDLSSARDKFRLRSKITKNVKMDYPSHKGYSWCLSLKRDIINPNVHCKQYFLPLQVPVVKVVTFNT